MSPYHNHPGFQKLLKRFPGFVLTCSLINEAEGKIVGTFQLKLPGGQIVNHQVALKSKNKKGKDDRIVSLIKTCLRQSYLGGPRKFPQVVER